MKKRAIVLVLVAVLIGSAVIGCSLADGRRSLMDQLEGSRPERTFAARLSIETRYHPCTPLPMSGDTTLRREECATGGRSPLRSGELGAARRSSDPDSLQASALSAVIWSNGREPRLDSAIVRLEKALRLSPGSVPLLVDLSAAHLIRAERTWNPRDLLQGYQYAAEAMTSEPQNRAALWNAALALQSAGLDWEADEAWNAYLAVDSRSEWADEARLRQDSLITEPLVIPTPGTGSPDSVVEAYAAEYPQQARELGWESVLNEWGEAVVSNKAARADSLLDFADQLGRLLEQRRGGDASLAAAVRSIRRAAGDSAATMALAQSHQAYAEGRAAIRALDSAKARGAFLRVVNYQPSSPLLMQWTTLWLAALAARGPDVETVLRGLLAEVDTIYPVLKGRAHAAMGRALLLTGHYWEGREQYRVSRALFHSAGEVESGGYVASMDGESAYESGDTLEAYRLMHRAHLALRRYDGSQARHNNLIALAKSATQDGMPRAALLIYDEEIRAAKRAGVKVNVAETLRYRAHAGTTLGDSAGAALDLDSALAWARKLEPANKERRLAEALIRLVSPDSVSTAAMDSTINALSENVLWLLPALLWRADARLAAGDSAGAIRDLDSVTARIQGLSSKESEVRLRVAMIEQARSRFDQLVMLHLARDNVDAALRALERGRVSLAPEGTRPLRPGRLSPPSGETVVGYTLIGDTLLAWIPRGDSPRPLRSVVDRDTFLLTVEQVNAYLESPDGEAAARPGLQSLYKWLIHPLRNYLKDTETLVILTDGEVAGVPFHALRDEERGRYLIEDHVLRFATTLADALAPPSTKRAPSGPVLLVADPAFDLSDHSTLERLPAAGAEVDSLRLLYRRAVVLADSDATREAFRTQAQTASVIHYAGHAVFDDARPERSYLVLAGPDTAGRLTAQDISEMELRGAPLVVLSACRSLRSREGRMDGFAGLSGELLAAGATGVIGGLWQANDELAKPLMVAFHREYQQRHKGDPARALRAAQLHMISLRDPLLSSPAAWAGFRYMGN